MKRISLKKKQIISVAQNIFYPLCAFAVMLAIWAIAAKVTDNKFVLPAPGPVIERFFKILGEKMFWRSVAATLLRTFICFFTSFMLALALAILSGSCKPIYKFLFPVISFLRAAPTVAVILVLYAFMRRDELAILVGFLIAFPIMYSAFYNAVVGVDGDLKEMAKVYKVRHIDRIRYIYLPSIEETLLNTSQSTLSLTLKVIIASEILTNLPISIGGRIQFAYSTLELDYLLSWTFMAIVFSFVLEGLVGVVKKIWRAAA